MGIYEDIRLLICEVLSKGAFSLEHKEAAERVNDWLNSPSCILVPEEELEDSIEEEQKEESRGE